MSTKHTPGPWEWGDDFRGLYGAGKDNEVMSTAPYENMWLSHKRDDSEREANARLIAASPKMHALLLRCLTGDGGSVEWLKEVRDLLEDEIQGDAS